MAEQQIGELRDSTVVQADDFAIKYCPSRPERLRNLTAQVCKGRKVVVVAGNETDPFAVDICERSEAIILNLEDPIGIGERLRPPSER